jgi:hypothetical protein
MVSEKHVLNKKQVYLVNSLNIKKKMKKKEQRVSPVRLLFIFLYWRDKQHAKLESPIRIEKIGAPISSQTDDPNVYPHASQLIRAGSCC